MGDLDVWDDFESDCLQHALKWKSLHQDSSVKLRINTEKSAVSLFVVNRTRQMYFLDAYSMTMDNYLHQKIKTSY